jgi:hypothetical protein
MENELSKKELERKLGVIKDKLQAAFPNSRINNRRKKGTIYIIQLDREGRLSCRLGFALECLLNQDEHKILERLKKEKVFENLSNTSKPMDILITETDVMEVTDIIQYG